MAKYQIIFCDSVHDTQVAQFDDFDSAAYYWNLWADTPTCFAGELKDLETDEVIWDFDDALTLP